MIYSRSWHLRRLTVCCPSYCPRIVEYGRGWFLNYMRGLPSLSFLISRPNAKGQCVLCPSLICSRRLKVTLICLRFDLSFYCRLHFINTYTYIWILYSIVAAGSFTDKTFTTFFVRWLTLSEITGHIDISFNVVCSWLFYYFKTFLNHL